MRAAIGLLLLVIGGFLIYELILGNASTIVDSLRTPAAATLPGIDQGNINKTPQTGGPSQNTPGLAPGQGLG